MTPTRFRSTSHQVLCLIGTGACAVLLLANVALGPNRGAQLLAEALLAVLLATSVRFAFSSIVVDRPNRVLVVRNPWQKHVIGFDAIDRIALRDSWVPNTYRNNRQLLVVVRRDGSRLTMIGGCAVGTPAVTRMRDDVQDALYG
ncbi:MAG TPA: hypothetical protein VIG48_06490 [Jatrophihabitans sp.]|jgi:hypothetical protein